MLLQNIFYLFKVKTDSKSLLSLKKDVKDIQITWVQCKMYVF